MKKFIIFIAIIIGLMGILSFFGNNGADLVVKNATIGDCVVSEDSKGGRTYDSDEAVCYIFKYLGGKDVTKEEIMHVIELENKYRDSNPPVGPGNDPVPAFVFENQTMGLTQEQVDKIYDAEYFYLKYIGVI